MNFFLGGMGAGLNILLFFFGRNMKWEEGIISAHYLELISAVLVATGLLSVAMEAGRPLRGLFLFVNIRHSWMSREILFAAAFIFLSVADWKINSTMLSLFSAIAAVLFVASQAMILYSSSAVPAWNRPTVPLFLISSALLNGFGLFLLLCTGNFYFVNTSYPLNMTMLVYGMSCISLTLAIWLWMVFANRDKQTRQILLHIRSKRMLIGEVGIGGLLPLLGLAGLAFQNYFTQGFMTTIGYALCSISILFYGFYRFYMLVFNIDYLRPVSVWIDKPREFKLG